MATHYGEPPKANALWYAPAGALRKEKNDGMKSLCSIDIELSEPEPEHEIFPESLKNAITAFICDYKRFPNKEQFAELKAEHVTYPEDPYFTFTHDGSEFACDFAQMTEEEVDAIKNSVNLSVGFKGELIHSVDLGDGISTQAYYVRDESAPVMVSALDSTKGMNKYNVSSGWLAAHGGERI